jgi:TonB family protein
MLIVSVAFSQSPPDQQNDLEPVLITPTDWESLKHVEMVEDDCDFEKKLESCETTFPKPRFMVADECNSAAKVLAAYKHCYPPLAKAAKVAGPVSVMVVVDEGGFVLWAHAWTGHPLLQPAAIKAACQWRFEPARCSSGFQTVNRMIAFYFEGAK